MPRSILHGAKRRDLHRPLAAAFFLKHIARYGRAFICGNSLAPKETHFRPDAPKTAILGEYDGDRVLCMLRLLRRNDLLPRKEEPQLVRDVRKKCGLVCIKAYHRPAAPQSRITGLCCRSNSSVVLRMCPGYTS